MLATRGIPGNEKREKKKPPEAGGFPIMTLPTGFLTKDVLFLAASFYLLKQDLTRTAQDIRQAPRAPERQPIESFGLSEGKR